MTQAPLPPPAPSDASSRLAQALRLVEQSMLDAEEGTIADVARRLDVLDMMNSAITSVAEILSDNLIARMETDVMAIEGVGTLVRKERTPSESWDNDAIRRDTMRTIVSRVATDKTTGEIRTDWSGIAREVTEWVLRTWPIGKPKLGRDAGFRALGLDPDEYVTRMPRGHEVRIER